MDGGRDPLKDPPCVVYGDDVKLKFRWTACL